MSTTHILCSVVFPSVGLIVMFLVMAKMQKRQRESRVKTMLYSGDCITTLDSVGGCQVAKQVLFRSVILPLRYPHLFLDSAQPSLHPPRGILLHGKPGTGKTLLARACANEANVPFVVLTATSLEDKYWGEATKTLQATFDFANKQVPGCIIFLDEID